MTGFKQIIQYFSVALVSFLFFMGVTLAAYFLIKNEQEEKQKSRFSFQTTQAENLINRRLSYYIQILKGAKSLFTASNSITRQEWESYIAGLEVYQNYPGIQGVGYTEVVKRVDLPDHIRKVRAEGFPDYTVTTNGSQPILTPIVYIEPFSGRNLRAFGFDMFSDATRRRAMERARDTGQPAITSKVRLIQETEAQVQPGFLIYLPVYRQSHLPATVAERRRLLTGYVYSPFRAGDLMQHIFKDELSDIAISIYDGHPQEEKNLFFTTHPRALVQEAFRANLYRKEIKLKVAGHTWTIIYQAMPGFKSNQSRLAEIVLLGGTIISFLVFFAFWSVGNLRSANKLRQTITDNATVALFMMNDKGYCTFMNAAAETMTGYTLAEVAQAPLHYLIHHHHPDGTPYPMEECPIDRALPTNNLLRAHQDIFIRKDGTFFPVSCAASPIFQNGVPVATVIEVKDLTEEKKNREALAHQHTITAAIAENATVGLFMLNADGYCTFMNPTAEQMTGFTFAEMQEQPLHNLIHHSHPDGSPFPIQDCAVGFALNQNKPLRSHQDKFIRKDGTFFDVSCSATPVYKNSSLAFMVLEVRDITEERRAEAAILESEARFRSMADNAPVMIWINDEQGGATYINKQWLEFTGQNYQEALGTGWKNALHPDDIERVQTVFVQAQGEKRNFEVDYRLKRHDDQYRWMVSNGTPRFDATGAFKGYIGSVIDITDRKEAEQKIQENANLLQKIFLEVPAIVALVRAADQTYIFSNPLYRKLLGNRALPGVNIREAHPDISGPGLFERVDEVIQSGKAYVGKELPVSNEINGKRQTGYFNLVYQPLLNPNQTVEGVLVFAIEVTELVNSRKMLMKANEELKHTNNELRRTNTDLDNFVYTASHDLKAPIANLEGLINDMMHSLYKKLAPDEQYLLQLLQDSNNKLKRTISDLTNITRVQKEVNENQKDLAFAEVLEDIMLDLKPVIEDLKAEFTLKLNEPKITYARKNLRSVLYNLVSNALKYHDPARTPQISITTSQEGEFIKLTVADNGLGIRQDQQHKLFSMFKRVHTHVEGSGIGLYIVKRIVENNGGRVELQSAPDKGSIFTVYFRK